ncbi:MAG: STAS domain-containing protein [Desulfobacterales bacterium]|nr:STAS domain-containing protein [Desulfobacterales bacterium]
MTMQPNANEVFLESQGTLTVLDIKGDITAFSEAPLGEAYRKASEQGADRIVLQIGKEAYINSGGIAVLIQILAKARRSAQRVAITGISEHFKKIFRMVGITKFADIFDSTADAIQVLE